MSNRDKRRNGIPFKEEKPYTLTASQMAAQVRIETEKLRVQYEEEIKRIQKQTVEKSITKQSTQQSCWLWLRTADMARND
jgi:hypothetical protein